MQTGVMKGQAMGYDKYWNLFFLSDKRTFIIFTIIRMLVHDNGKRLLFYES